MFERGYAITDKNGELWIDPKSGLAEFFETFEEAENRVSKIDSEFFDYSSGGIEIREAIMKIYPVNLLPSSTNPLETPANQDYVQQD